MKRKGLFMLVALALGGIGSAYAQDAQDDAYDAGFDDRWYISATVGGYYNDTDRNTNSRQLYYGLGFGKYFTPDVSLEFSVDHTGRDVDDNVWGGNWYSNALGVSARFFANDPNAWRPYLMVGALASHHTAPWESGWSPAVQAGGGVSKAISDDSDIRFELAYRYDMDTESQPQFDSYGDWLLGISFVSRLGDLPPPPPPPVEEPPPPPDCSTLDDDGDGVNNCEDQCAATEAGTIVGPDGCAKAVVIDLRGVNFKFDRPSRGETDIAPTLKEPTADSIAILDQAIDTLTRYPNVTVELQGHTDSIGSDTYNQGLSERRAQIVYDYLVGNGISASRITDVEGYGETQPIATNDTKEGRAQNRRTELAVDND